MPDIRDEIRSKYNNPDDKANFDSIVFCFQYIRQLYDAAIVAGWSDEEAFRFTQAFLVTTLQGKLGGSTNASKEEN